MARHSPLGSSLLKQSDHMGKNKTSPERTQKFLDKMEHENKEGMMPPSEDIAFSRYKGDKYTINRNGEVKSLNGEVMKPFFHPNKRGQRVRIKGVLKMKEGYKIIDKEVSVLSLMRIFFGRYISGHTR